MGNLGRALIIVAGAEILDFFTGVPNPAPPTHITLPEEPSVYQGNNPETAVDGKTLPVLVQNFSDAKNHEDDVCELIITPEKAERSCDANQADANLSAAHLIPGL